MSDKEHWHLKREVNFTHIITTILVIISAIWWGSSIETRQAVLETKIHAIENTTAKIEAYLIRIENKVDRLK